LHFVLDNLPQSTKAPELDDTNAKSSLLQDAEWTGVDLSSGLAVDTKQLGIYLAYLRAIGFLESPTETSAQLLPDVVVSEVTLEKLRTAGGRSTKS
jgi:L-aminoadipate-semialdehyde dehydrogenase